MGSATPGGGGERPLQEKCCEYIYRIFAPSPIICKNCPSLLKIIAEFSSHEKNRTAIRIRRENELTIDKGLLHMLQIFCFKYLKQELTNPADLP